MKSYDNVYVLWTEDECGEEYMCGIFSGHEKAQGFADDHIDGWYNIEEKTLDVGDMP